MFCIHYGQGHDCPGIQQLLLGFILQEIKIVLTGAWFSGQLRYFSEGLPLGMAWFTEVHWKDPGFSCPWNKPHAQCSLPTVRVWHC